MRLRILVALGTVACSSPSKPAPTSAVAPANAYEATAVPRATGRDLGARAEPVAPTSAKLAPVGERAQLLREAAAQLEKAGVALERGNKNLAEQLFSTAELLVGDGLFADLAPLFRDGAPPRITTPTERVDVSAKPQPKVAGSSEAEDAAAKVAPPKAAVGSLTGTLMIDGKPANTYGLVTLEPASGTWKPRTPKKIVIEQRGRQFLPSVVAISVGSTISFPNFDTIFHNVFSTSPAGAFDLGLYKAGEARAYTFTKEGIVRLGCNLHANMSAHIAVVAAPAYVVTDDKGAFAFRRVVPGKYKLRAWSVRSKEPITQDVTIKAGANQLTIGVAADAPAGPLPDKFGGKRG